ncbi:hypothetical protein LIER_04005 [Lithospermum erythrorhizon]|uniref:C3H1-type domain-containing protein n=1 Tax=Lithospermum erythrorhizon TaxID=34254 RepID=A0AAV3NVX2_LITER
MVMEAKFQEQADGVESRNCSKLLELAACDDLTGFKSEVEEKGSDVDGLSYWYGRKIGSRKMGLEERTPIMVAALYGSLKVLEFILGARRVDVNKACGSDGATALHCAVAGCANSSVEVVKLLIEFSADINSVCADGKKPGDLIPSSVKFAGNSKRKSLEILLKGGLDGEEDKEVEEEGGAVLELLKEGTEKKEYPIDVSLPDINTGLYGTDEFRMFSFKVKPCSRAYSHDWTECPFVHPGENARRRDPLKYNYSCVPCPEFKKGTCAKGDSCEYAHGVFESWLHPAQYRTRLCKDETGCSRKVCFFAHRPEELRPLHPSTGSAMPSPKSFAANSMDMAALSPLALGSPSLMMPTSSTPPMSPVAACSSPMSTSMWQNKLNLNFTPPALQLQGSRLKTASSARDLDLEMEILGLENIHTRMQHRQQLIDEMTSLSSPSSWNNEYNRMGDLKPTNLDDVFGSHDPSFVSQYQSLSPRVATPNASQTHSPTGRQMHQNMNHLRASYPSNVSSPVRKPVKYGFDSSAAVAAAVMNSRSAAFAKRSQSFVDRASVNHHHGIGAGTGANSPNMRSSNLSADWSSPDGRLEWGYSGEDGHKLQKSASFGYRNGNTASPKNSMAPSSGHEPDVSWVHSLVKDVSSTDAAGLYSSQQKHTGEREMIPPWVVTNCT